ISPSRVVHSGVMPAAAKSRYSSASLAWCSGLSKPLSGARSSRVVMQLPPAVGALLCRGGALVGGERASDGCEATGDIFPQRFLVDLADLRGGELLDDLESFGPL